MTAIAPSSAKTPTLSEESLLGALHWRYATKVFDPAKKLSTSQWETLEQSLVLSPSSFGLQPWRFVIVESPAIRAKLKPVSWDQGQITDASHLVVLAARTKVDESDIQEYVEQISKVRSVPTSSLEQYRQMMVGNIVSGPRAQTSFEWATRQCYIALGNLMTSAALLGIDTCPLEGIDPAAYDVILELPKLGYKTVVACAVGFRSSEDKYAQLNKVRFPASKIIIKK